MARLAASVSVTVLVGVGLIVSLVIWQLGASQRAAAVPATAQARYYDITVTTGGGKEFNLPDKTVTCGLEFLASPEEGVYNCPAPYDIQALLSPPMAFAGAVSGMALVDVEIDAGTIVSGLPANSWQTVQIGYGATLTSANVFLGEELTEGQNGHIENTSLPNISRGVHPSYFYYRSYTNSSGYMGTEWLAKGTQ